MADETAHEAPAASAADMTSAVTDVAPTDVGGPPPAVPHAPPSTPPPTSHGWSAAIASLAFVALIANCFLTSPARFDARPWPTGSLLRPIVEALGFHASLGTPHGVEIRNLAFGLGAAGLALVAGLRLLIRRGPREPLIPDELDLDRLAGTPTAWWLLLAAASALSTLFSHALDVARGGAVVRLMMLAWWWALAVVLTRRHAARLAAGLVAVLTALAALATWYQAVRAADPAGRLSYPIGNEGWMGACLLPGVVIAFVWLFVSRRPSARDAAQSPAHSSPASGRWASFGLRVLAAVAFGVIGNAMLRTQTRSAMVGFGAAIVAACYLVAGRLGRRVIAAGGVAVLVAGAWLAWHVGSGAPEAAASGGALSWLRMESIRSRVEHEWPFAWRLFLQKPMLGHGEGGYAMLAGRMARAEQFAEPAITAITAGPHAAWPSHAHNEYLELLADLGLVGAVAFVAAILATLHRTARFVARSEQAEERALVIALAAALAGMAVEIAFGVALRNPGLTPIFLTVWGTLWAMLLPRERATMRPVDPAAPRRVISIRGTAAVLASLALGWMAVQDWRASLAQQEAGDALAKGRPGDAIADADFAATWRCDPFRHLLAMLQSANLRTASMRASQTNDNSDLQLGHDALAILNRVKAAAPRFLATARLEAETAAGLAARYKEMHRAREVRDFRQLAISALQQQVRDEPFDVAGVAQLWQADPALPTAEQLQQLRAVMRMGVIDDRWWRLFAEVRDRSDYGTALNDLLAIARADQDRPPQRWADPLSPETFRLSAANRYVLGEPAVASADVGIAARFYAKAGRRLAGGLAAATYEQAEYLFTAEPPLPGRADADVRCSRLLAMLDEAERIRRSLGFAWDPTDRIGRLRVSVLVVAGRTDEARSAVLSARVAGRTVVPESAWGAYAAGVYCGLLRRFAAGTGLDETLVADWVGAAERLAPDDPGVLLALCETEAARGKEAAARRYFERFTRASRDSAAITVAKAYLTGRFPALFPSEGNRTPARHPTSMPTSPDRRPGPTSRPASPSPTGPALP